MVSLVEVELEVEAAILAALVLVVEALVLPVPFPLPIAEPPSVAEPIEELEVCLSPPPALCFRSRTGGGGA
uniref:Putative secreted protein n=1 Tax=Anopheles triannulatus TaxID=58253 RepID=A0A2M4B375_9DIPT